MKRACQLYDLIANWENLRLAAAKALRGKRTRRDARDFVARWEENLGELLDQLQQQRVTLGPARQFVIHDPKERMITAPCFRDRVLHHAIMNVCEPVFERWLIDDTFACRRGLGRITALLRARQFAARFEYVLKLDIRKYFDNISHVRLLTRLERRFKDRPLLALFRQVIESHHVEPSRGLPIGSLTSQHLANFYLGYFDRFVKHKLQARGYVRYMDDCALWADDRTTLRHWLREIRRFLREELDLRLKPEPYVRATRLGMSFLGCRVLPARLVLNRRSRRRFEQRLASINEQFQSGQLDEVELQARATALVAFTQTEGVDAWGVRRGVLERLALSGPEPWEAG